MYTNHVADVLDPHHNKEFFHEVHEVTASVGEEYRPLVVFNTEIDGDVHPLGT